MNTGFANEGNYNQPPESSRQKRGGKYIHHGESHLINLEGQHINGDLEISWIDKKFKEDELNPNDDVSGTGDGQSRATTERPQGGKTSTSSSSSGSRMSHPLNNIVIRCIRYIELLLKFTSGLCFN